MLPGTSSPAQCWEGSSQRGKALTARLASRFQVRSFPLAVSQIFSFQPRGELKAAARERWRKGWGPWIILEMLGKVSNLPSTTQTSLENVFQAPRSSKRHHLLCLGLLTPDPSSQCEEERVQKRKNYKIELRSGMLEEQTLQTRWTVQT
nr:transmembrane protein 14A isoform X1 [Bubalus bubalis]